MREVPGVLSHVGDKRRVGILDPARAAFMTTRAGSTIHGDRDHMK